MVFVPVITRHDVVSFQERRRKRKNILFPNGEKHTAFEIIITHLEDDFSKYQEKEIEQVDDIYLYLTGSSLKDLKILYDTRTWAPYSQYKYNDISFIFNSYKTEIYNRLYRWHKKTRKEELCKWIKCSKIILKYVKVYESYSRSVVTFIIGIPNIIFNILQKSALEYGCNLIEQECIKKNYLRCENNENYTWCLCTPLIGTEFRFNNGLFENKVVSAENIKKKFRNIIRDTNGDEIMGTTYLYLSLKTLIDDYDMVQEKKYICKAYLRISFGGFVQGDLI